MPKATDFKTNDTVGNSLFKGAGFHKNDKTPASPAAKQPATSTTSKLSNNIDFDTLSNEEKNAFCFALEDWNTAAGNPIKWAKSQASLLGIPTKVLQNAANKLREDLDDSGGNVNTILRYPWWSAARDWNPDAIGAAGQKISNGFKFSPEMASVVSDSFRR